MKRRLPQLGELRPRPPSASERELRVRAVLAASPSIAPAAQMAEWLTEEVPWLRPLALGASLGAVLIALGDGSEGAPSTDAASLLRADVLLQIGPGQGPNARVCADKELRLTAPNRAVARALARGFMF